MFAQVGNQSQFTHLHHKLHVQGHMGRAHNQNREHVEPRALVDPPSPNHMINPTWNNSHSQKNGGRLQHHMLEQRHERTSHFGAQHQQQQLSHSYDGYVGGRGGDSGGEIKPYHVSSQVRLRFPQDEKKRSSTLDARDCKQQSYDHHAFAQRAQQQPDFSPRQRWRKKSAELAAQQNQQQTGMLPAFTSDDRIEEEFTEQSCDSRPSQAQLSSSTLTALPQELLQQLDFEFFRSVYSAYNTIWQQVMKLQIYGQNFVRRDDFVRVLKNCKVLPADNVNVFCNFLLFSCASHLKKSQKRTSQESQPQPLLLLDFRFFLKSVFMTLKRQFNEDDVKGAKTIDSQDQERIFHAEMFLVDHFWMYVCQTEPNMTQNLPPDASQSKDSGSVMNRSMLDGQNERNSADSIPMELLQKKIFEFFDRRQPPFLLQIHEIELLVTECFKNLIERKKRKDKISKRTFKKVISRQCPGLLARTFLAFIPGGANGESKTQQPSQRLTPFSLPISDSNNTGRTGMNASGNQVRSSYGKVVDHHMPSNRQQQLQPKSSTTHTAANLSMTGGSYEIKQEIQAANRDQKSIHEHHVEQTEQQPEKQKQAGPEKRGNLCKQLETKIVVNKLQKVLDSVNVRAAFMTLVTDPNPLIEVRGNVSANICTESHSEGTDEIPPHLISENTFSSEKIEVPVEKSPRRTPSGSQDKYIIPVQSLNQREMRVREASKKFKMRKQQSREQGIREATFSTKFSNVMTAPNSHLSMAQACTSHDATSCCPPIQNEAGSSYNHLQSFHQQTNKHRILSLGGPQSMENSGQVMSIDSNYRTSCFQEAAAEQKVQRKMLPRESSQSDQKLQPSDFYVVSESSSAREIIQQQYQQCQRTPSRQSDTVSTAEMLKHILQNETQNQHCLQELVARIQHLETLNNSKSNSRDQTFQQVHNLRFLRQSPTFSLNSTPNTTSGLQRCNFTTHKAQHVSNGDIHENCQDTTQSAGVESCTDLNCYCRHQNYDPIMIEQQGETSPVLQQQPISSDPRRMLHSSNHHMLGGLKTSTSQNASISQSQSISQQHSQDADLCGSVAEGYCQNQQFYEVSQEGQRVRQEGEAYADDYGDEMDFEANKEQRPLQIAAQLQENQSAPELSVSVSEFTDSRGNAPSKTISDAYVDSTQMPSIVGGNEYYLPSASCDQQNPYLMTTSNSHGRSTAARYHFAGGSKVLSANHMSRDKIGVMQLQAASLSYTISDSKIGNSNRTSDVGAKNQNNVTSAPNLQGVVSGGVLASKQEIPEKPYSNRINDGDEQKYDPLNYLTSSRNPDHHQEGVRSIEVASEEQSESKTSEMIFQRKYKKMKRHVKNMLQEKRLLEDRVESAIRDAQVLQNHLQTTAQSAQEVSNHNEELQHELRIRKLFFAIRTFVRVREMHGQPSKNERMQRAFLRWNLHSEKIGFFSEQTQHQEVILSELSRHEHDFKHQIVSYERRLGVQTSRERFKALKQLLRNRWRTTRAMAFARWKVACCTSKSTRRTENQRDDLKQDLTQVVTQLNKFRIQLVLAKLRSAVKRSVNDSHRFAFRQMQEFPGQPAKTPNQSRVAAPQQLYKSPFMQHLASQSYPISRASRQHQTENTNDSICTVVNNLDQSTMSRPSQEQLKRRSVQSLEAPLPPRSQSFSKPGLIHPQQVQQRPMMILQSNKSDTSLDRYENVPLRAPRQQLKMIQRSHSESKPTKKEEFRMRMDNRMVKMRQQGQQVEGLVKLHAFFTRVKQREELYTRHCAFFQLFSHMIELKEVHRENIRQTFQERQIFAMHHSKQHGIGGTRLGSRVASATNISQTSSAEVSMRGPVYNANATASTSSLQLGSQHFKGETPISVTKQEGVSQYHSSQQQPVQRYNGELLPREYNLPPRSMPCDEHTMTMQRQNSNDYPHLERLKERRAMMRHQRSESENMLEAPRIMMNMSPSMHNISGPDLLKSQNSSMHDYDTAMRRRSIPPRPRQRWLP